MVAVACETVSTVRATRREHDLRDVNIGLVLI